MNENQDQEIKIEEEIKKLTKDRDNLLNEVKNIYYNPVNINNIVHKIQIESNLSTCEDLFPHFKEALERSSDNGYTKNVTNDKNFLRCKEYFSKQPAFEDVKFESRKGRLYTSWKKEKEQKKNEIFDDSNFNINDTTKIDFIKQDDFQDERNQLKSIKTELSRLKTLISWNHESLPQRLERKKAYDNAPCDEIIESFKTSVLLSSIICHDHDDGIVTPINKNFIRCKNELLLDGELLRMGLIVKPSRFDNERIIMSQNKGF